MRVRAIFSGALTVLLSLAAQTSRARADSYGAIAYSQQSGYWAWSVSMSSASDADQQALSSCKRKGAGCEVVESFSNTCAALAVDASSHYGPGKADTRQQAESNALTACRSKGGSNCQIKIAYCVNPPSPTGKARSGP